MGEARMLVLVVNVVCTELISVELLLSGTFVGNRGRDADMLGGMQAAVPVPGRL